MNSEKHSEKQNAELKSESHSETETQKKTDWTSKTAETKIDHLKFTKRMDYSDAG